ncbi:hypothetical protein CROQUDRAFT_37975 [Cronartium quercuum f. sp. fusiforme G11]|uniref:UFSP1/2/DUB catalytic domain-containing protein n=1 Tax=Cronartium quercuum f. sp. fusiforme G11 TaxID=708437 RepID=A0A9P6TG25_9BASI|nr:hypothetical protein CROQUDRAFT_37975 [Cronartium quercuum f. sp. fusiforme G11]
MEVNNEPIPCCPVCDIEWDKTINKEAHVATCLGDTGLPKAPILVSGDDEPDEENDELELHQSGSLQKAGQKGSIKPGGNLKVDGLSFLLNHIRELLSQSFNDGQTQSAIICHPTVVHLRTTSSLTTRGQGDLTWGCGYRNIQMLFSSLRHLKSYRTALSTHPELNPSHSLAAQPSASKRSSMSLNEDDLIEIPNIQTWQRIIEAAWKQGFDVPGAESFSQKLVGKKKWIGTTEAYVAFTSLGIRARIIDFPKPTGPKRSHLGLTDWVRGYFNDTCSAENESDAFRKLMSSEGPIRMTNKMPLYLQHAGHSRTIVGVETDAHGNGNLLIFDPAKSVPATLKTASSQLTRAGSPTSMDTTNGRLVSSPSSSKDGLSVPSSSTSTFSRRHPFSLKRHRRVHDFLQSHNAPIDLRQHSKLLASFRVSFQSLNKHDQYQVGVWVSGLNISQLDI